MKKLLLILSIVLVSCAGATVKQLKNIKLKDNVVVKVQSNNETISVDEQSNLSTNYRGLTEVVYEINPSTSNEWYYTTTDLGGEMSLVITSRSRESARLICSHYFKQIHIVQPKESIAGIKQSYIEFDYLNPTNGSYEVCYNPTNFIFGLNKSFTGSKTGVSTNFVCIVNITNDKFVVDSFELTPVN